MHSQPPQRAHPPFQRSPAGLLLSLGYSLAINFILGGERERTTVSALMAAPYKRILVLHVAVIAGGFGIANPIQLPRAQGNSRNRQY